MFPIDFFAKAVRLAPDRIAAEDGTRQLTFAQLWESAQALAAAVQVLTGKKRPTVAVLSPNSLDLLIAIMAMHAGGFVFTPLNPRNARVELDAQLAVARPDLLILDPSAAEKISPFTGPVVMTRGNGAGTDIKGLVAQYARKAATWSVTDAGAVNAIKFTGGSSGRPKAVMQTFRNMNAVAASLMTAFDFTADERYLVAAPMTHGAGMFLLPVLARGGCCIIREQLDADMILHTLQTQAVTLTWVPPTLLYMMIDRAQGRTFPALRHLIWGGAAAAPERLEQARTIFGPVIETVFGQTEASTICTALRAHEITDAHMWESVGRATLLMQVAIRNSEGIFLPPGEAGEIVLRGDLVMQGYLGMEKETAEVLRDGWLHTGDVGYLDAKGYLFIKDRLKDVIISGGYNIYPSDVEAALARHPAIAESVVFGLPDAKWGERVEAAIQLKPGQIASSDEIIAFAKTQVGSVKAPKAVHLVPDLPKSPVGKVLRREARRIFAEGAAQP